MTLSRREERRLKKRRRRIRKLRRLIRRLLPFLLAAVLVLLLIQAGKKIFGKEGVPEAPDIIRNVQSYPLKYTEIICRYAPMYDLEPAYVSAVILAESSFDTNATSNVGARGLMQIMPDTGEWLAGKYGDDFTEDSLYDPEVSIRYGCWYLGYLMRSFGSMQCASAAYHSGQGTVREWLKNPEYSRDGQTLDVIPTQKTNTYVTRILGYYEEYTKMFEQLEETGMLAYIAAAAS